MMVKHSVKRMKLQSTREST